MGKQRRKYLSFQEITIEKEKLELIYVGREVLKHGKRVRLTGSLD